MQVEEFQIQLESKREELSRRIEAIKGDFAKGRSADFAEQATETENDEVLKNLEFEAQHELTQVNNALHRIKLGNYGQCERCGEDIQMKRLVALPYATMCSHCAD